VEEIENRKIALTERCTARQQENLLVTQALTAFMERYNEVRYKLEDQKEIRYMQFVHIYMQP
jgi:hypothetical protein